MDDHRYHTFVCDGLVDVFELLPKVHDTLHVAIRIFGGSYVRIADVLDQFNARLIRGSLQFLQQSVHWPNSIFTPPVLDGFFELAESLALLVAT